MATALRIMRKACAASSPSMSGGAVRAFQMFNKKGTSFIYDGEVPQ